MKKIIATAIAFLAFHSLSAQEETAPKASFPKNIFSSEVGLAYTGSGDLPGTMLGFEYQRAFTKRFRAGLGLNALNFDLTDYNTAAAKSLEAALYFDMIKTKRFALTAIGGGYGRRFAFERDEREHQYLRTPYENGLGYTLGLGFAFNTSKQTALGFRQLLQNDDQGNITHTWRMAFSIKL